jgi:hypothetical protein
MSCFIGKALNGRVNVEKRETLGRMGFWQADWPSKLCHLVLQVTTGGRRRAYSSWSKTWIEMNVRRCNDKTLSQRPPRINLALVIVLGRKIAFMYSNFVFRFPFSPCLWGWYRLIRSRDSMDSRANLQLRRRFWPDSTGILSLPTTS